MTVNITTDLVDLTLDVTLMLGPEVLHLALIFDPLHGPVLVDTGTPGQLTAITQALSDVNVNISDLRTILITHHDNDHIGALPDVVKASGAAVWAAPQEVAFIQDGVRGHKLPPLDRVDMALQNMPEPMRPAMRAMFTYVQPPIPVARHLQDDEVLDIAGGVRVISTPGHTVGHTSFFLERSRILISGDALMADKGRLLGPWDRATPDMKSAAESVGRLATLEPAAILCYHGGLVSEDVGNQLRRVAQDLANQYLSV
ncbi:MBL fold metallo-hydrolase (plasmid) [Deinococcus radiomollis]|uniref:MBL fold metallo-hydrolase n=1 Tax=Deinococcus radiomollis TaxID=468916 RepID=UPI003891B989